jgi:hypothetical protein
MTPTLITGEKLLNAGLPSGLIPILRSRPVVVTLIGSSRYPRMIRTMYELTLLKFIVIPPRLFGNAEGPGSDDPWKTDIDLLQLDKIDKSDIVYVMNPGGCIGPGTKSEIDYARQKGKCLIFEEGSLPDE